MYIKTPRATKWLRISREEFQADLGLQTLYTQRMLEIRHAQATESQQRQRQAYRHLGDIYRLRKNLTTLSKHFELTEYQRETLSGMTALLNSWESKIREGG